ncbi:MAG: dynamin family protein [Bdellovibrio bacteriovorus]
MQIPALQQHLALYQQWKTRVAQALLELERWLGHHRRATPRARERLRATQDVIRRDRLTVAVVGESARGKSELINALLYSDPSGPLLPPAGGNGSPCPTELLWDEQRDEAYLRLLPVESRAQGTPIGELKADPKHWVHYPLNVQVPEQVAGTLREIQQTKSVSLAEASRLGLSSMGLPGDGPTPPQRIEIPKWRYALVSFPHPLLRQGMAILATPGVAALGQEPELTTTLIPAAQAVLFVVAANESVTPSDLQLWQQHLKGFQSERQRAMLVALNKVDLLWERLRDGAAVDTAIATLRKTTAQALGIDPELVLPVSAHKGLMAKARKDEALLRRSGLPTLERYLGQRLVVSKHRLLVDAIEANLGQELEINRARIAARIARFKAELEQLEALRDKSEAAVNQLLDRTRREQELYLKGVLQFQRCREELLGETRLCRQILEADSIESTIERCQRQLTGSWTSTGLARAMRGLFEELRRIMQTVSSECERVRRLVRQTYQSFHDDYGFEVATPKVFIPMKYSVEIELLLQEVESFRRSPAMILAGPGRVVRRFDEEMVSRARVLFEQLRMACDGWIREALQPLAEEIATHKGAMEKRLESLQRIGRSKEELQTRIDQLQRQHVAYAQDLTALRNIHNALHNDPLAEQEALRRPRLVSG